MTRAICWHKVTPTFWPSGWIRKRTTFHGDERWNSCPTQPLRNSTSVISDANFVTCQLTGGRATIFPPRCLCAELPMWSYLRAFCA